MGVTSLMPLTSSPVFMSERIAVSRPEPGPLTMTSTVRRPCSIARRAHCSAASWAANGVDLREPLKPTLPADAQATTLPCESEIETIVLLNDDLMCTTPCVMFLRSFLRGRRPPGFGLATYSPSHRPTGKAGSACALLLLACTTYAPSSCRRRSSWGPCACGRWYGSAGRAQA